MGKSTGKKTWKYAIVMAQSLGQTAKDWIIIYGDRPRSISDNRL